MRQLTAIALACAASLCLAAGGAPARTPDVKPPVLDDIEQMCALLTSCESLPLPAGMIPGDFARCVHGMSAELAKASAVAFSLSIRECGLRANTCAELRACALRGAKPDACVGRGGQGTVGFCDSDGRALSCLKDKVLAVRDCPRGGEQCVVRGGEASCALGPCPAEMQEGAAPVCSGSGTRILRCEKGKLSSLDCTAFGLKCVAAPDGPACAPESPACAAGSQGCDGNVAIACHHGREVRIDCAAAGLVCSASGAQVGACAVPDKAERTDKKDKCDPASPPRCDGASIKYCADGRARSYPCRTVGFNRCVTDARGARCAS